MKSVSWIGRLGKLVVILLSLVLLGGAAWGVWYWKTANNKGPSFRTEHVTHGNLVATISATGTIEPEEVIDIGAQIAGQIKAFGVDENNTSKRIDYRSKVEAGTILALIDDSLYKPDVETAKADLNLAKADVNRAKADLDVAKSKLVQTSRDWERAKRLGPGKVIADVDYDTAQNAYETATANVPSAQANLEKAQRTVEMKQAILDKAEKNLGYCTIRSPVKGVIVDRRVNIGQTVVASLQAPSLFLLAKDLSRLQVWASVNEADIGNIHEGQTVTFTVDTYPTDTFKGVVTKVRLNASMTQNVVTYTVEVTTDNPVDKDHPDGKLLPYLTANLQFKVAEEKDVLLVPNSALRWQPKPEVVAPEYRDEFVQALRRKAAPEEGKQASGGEAKQPHNRATVWVEDGEYVRPVKVRTGLTDGFRTKVVLADPEKDKDELKEGTPLVVGLNQKGGAPQDASNPFVTKMFSAPKKGP
jgi:HlyD family secretion protein